MRCEEVRPLVEAWCDGELKGTRHEAVAQHLVSCQSCAALANETQQTANLLKRYAREIAPPSLALGLRGLLREEDALSPVKPEISRWRRGLRQAAVLVVCCGLSALLAWHVASSFADRRDFAREVTSAHIRALQLDTPVQIASSDRHTVKPWFAGRLDFAPEVRDLAAHHFTMVGGRVDYLGERRVAALVYKRREHLINVFAWPSAGTSASRLASAAVGASTLKGYNSIHWESKGFTLWAVSDLNVEELAELRDLL